MTPIESESLVETAKTANGILTKLIGPAAEEWGGIISDNLKPRRLKNQIRNLKKVQQIVQDEGLKLRNVNLKVLFPYLENVSLEEDESLQNMWANLFTNYIDVNVTLTTTVYPNILSQLSSDEIKILNTFEERGGSVEMRMSGETYPTDLLGEAMSNLIRLGIIGEIAAYSQYPSNDPHVTNPQWSIEQVASEDFFLTDFGWNFIKACKRDSFSPQI